MQRKWAKDAQHSKRVSLISPESTQLRLDREHMGLREKAETQSSVLYWFIAVVSWQDCSKPTAKPKE